MANLFYPFPIVGGSNNVWGTALNVVLQSAGIASLTAELYNDAGALKLSKGEIGIDDGTVKGISIIDTITTISTLGMTASNWHKVEMSVSGTSVTISIGVIAGATDESTIDAATKAAYDYSKQGYYLVGTKRLLGVVYLRAALALGRIVNCESGKLGFKGIRRLRYFDGAMVETIKYYDKIKVLNTGWDMDATSLITATMPFTILYTSNPKLDIIVVANDGTKYNINYTGAGGARLNSANQLILVRTAAGTFDAAAFNAASVIIDVEWET